MIWADDDPILDATEQRHDQRERSLCCDAPCIHHWPCDEQAKCSACQVCAVCESDGQPNEKSQEEMQEKIKEAYMSRPVIMRKDRTEITVDGVDYNVIDAGLLRIARQQHSCAGNGAGENKKRTIGCSGTIARNMPYIEYVDHVAAYQSGSRHCLKCSIEYGLLIDRADAIRKMNESCHGHESDGQGHEPSQDELQTKMRVVREN